METLRQRLPFKFSDNDEEDHPSIMDDQEQEAVIEILQRENFLSTEHHYKFLQGCLSFMIVFHIWFLLSPRHRTPMHVFFPNARTPLPSLIPFAKIFTLLNILLLLNLVLHLPKTLSFPRILHSTITRFIHYLPPEIQANIQANLPLHIGWTAVLLFVPPFVSVISVKDIPQVLWWFSPLFVVGVVVLVMSWIRDTNTELERLEALKYNAKGA